MQNEKVRIYHLAHELDMESKELLDLCRQHGIDARNQLSTITAEQRDAIVALVRNKTSEPAAPPKPAVPPVLPPKHVPNLTPRRRRRPASPGQARTGSRRAGAPPCLRRLKFLPRRILLPLFPPPPPRPTRRRPRP